MQRIAVALLLAGVLLVASWVVAGDPPARRATPIDAPAPIEQISQLIADVNTQVELLRERMAMERRFASPSRDPFRFSTSQEAAPVAPPVQTPVVEPEAPALPQLVAILTDKADAGLARRAVFSMNGNVRIVSVGDSLDRFDVARIDADGVELKARDTSAITRIPIK